MSPIEFLPPSTQRNAEETVSQPATPESQDSVEYKMFQDKAGREYLIHVADNFIKQAREAQPPYDAVVFLDKSARLVSNLIRRRWRFLHEDEQLPDFKFAKIGREMGHFNNRDYTATYTPIQQDVFRRGGWARGKYGDLSWSERKLPSIRDMLYRKSENKYSASLLSQLQRAFGGKQGTALVQKRVLIVDEYISSGKTLAYAKHLFTHAFPEAHVDAAALTARYKSDFDEVEREKRSGQSVSHFLPVSIHVAPHRTANYNNGLVMPKLPSDEHKDKVFIARNTLDQLSEIAAAADAKADRLVKKSRQRAWTQDGQFKAEMAARDAQGASYAAGRERDSLQHEQEIYRQAYKELTAMAETPIPVLKRRDRAA